MADRRRQVELLVGSRFDGLFVPAGGLRTRSGLVPGALKACPECGHLLERGWVVDAFRRRRPCLRCGGAEVPSGRSGQWLRRDGGAGRVAFDRMDSLEVPVGSEVTFATARPRKTRPCDGCGGDGVYGNGRRCGVCGGSGRREVHAFDLRLDGVEGDPEPLEDAIVARDRSGSYHELDLALAGISHHVNKPARFAVLTVNAGRVLRLLDELFLPPVSAEYEGLPVEDRVLVDLALEYVVGRMPDPIRVPADVVANARERAEWARRVKGRAVSNGAVRVRDAEIRRLVRRLPVSRVAFEFGLSVSQVNRIVAGQDEDAA